MMNKQNYKIASGATGLLTAVLLACPALAANLPTGASVVAGEATYTNSNWTGGPILGHYTKGTITQATDRAVINWSEFNIGAWYDKNYSVEFRQPSSSAITLNRVTGNQASNIYGSLTANGTIILVNGNGINFQNGASVNVGGLLATTSNISNNDFMGGDITSLSFSGTSTKGIYVSTSAQISAPGIIALVAPIVENEGTISGKNVALGSGNNFSIDLDGDGLISWQANNTSDKANNSGTITGTNRVLMTAAAVNGVLSGVINMDGVIQADGASVGNDGSVTLMAGTVNVKGSISTKGGDVTVASSARTTLDKATINTSKTGGIGGDVTIGNGAIAIVNNSSVTTGGGNITMTGTGTGGTFSGVVYDIGIQVNKSTINAGGGNVTMVGTGRAGAVDVGYNHGIRVNNKSVIQTSGDGNISLEGYGGKGGLFANNYGVFIDNADIYSIGTGSVTISGLGGGNQSGSNYGIRINSSDIGKTTSNSSIKIVADTIDFQSNSSFSTLGEVFFKTFSDETSIGIAGASGTLQLTSALLNKVTADTIRIGATNGAITANTYTWGAALNGSNAILQNNNANIVINGHQELGNHTFAAASEGGNIVVGSSGKITSTASGTPIVLAASNGHFINNRGANAISASNGRWLVYTSGPVGDTIRGLFYSFEQYNAPYPATAAQPTGNGFLYNTGLNFNVALSGPISKEYDGNTTATIGTSNIAITSPVGFGYTTADLSGITATYDNANVLRDVNGNVLSTKEVTVTGIGLSGVNNTTTGKTVYGYTINNGGSGTVSANVGEITPRALTIKANDKEMTYGGGNSYSGITIGSSLVAGEGISSADLNSSVTTSSTSGHWNAGDYTITASNAAGTGGFNANNYAIDYVSGSLKINKASLTISAVGHNKEYDGTPASSNTPTVTGLVSTLSGVGDSVEGLKQQFNSKDVSTANTLIVSYSSINDGNGGNNYLVTTNTAKGKITPRALTITANDQSITYGDGKTLNSGVATNGLVSGETLGNVVLWTTADLYKSSTSHQWNAGSYSIIVSSVGNSSTFNKSNYKISTKQGSLTVNKKALTITAQYDEKTYDGTKLSLLTPTVDGLVRGDSVAFVPLAAQYFDSKNVMGKDGSKINVGAYGVIDGRLFGSNYDVNVVSTTGTINPKPLTITANNQTITYGDGNTLTEGYDVGKGLVGFERITAVSLDTNANKWWNKSLTSGYWNAGTYDIAASGATGDRGFIASNYAITYQTGTLKILPKTLTITAQYDEKTYDGTRLSFELPSIDGLVKGDKAVAWQYFTSKDVMGEDGSTIKVGGYGIIDGRLRGSNYDVQLVSATGTINPKTLYVKGYDIVVRKPTDIPDPLLYGPNGPYGRYGFALGDSSSLFTGSLGTEKVSDFVRVMTVGSLSAGNNYKIVFEPGYVTIDPNVQHGDAFTYLLSKASGRRGPNGTLLAMVNNIMTGGLADLAPKAGGDDPQQLADLNPQAGGATALIQCNEVTPCDILQ